MPTNKRITRHRSRSAKDLASGEIAAPLKLSPKDRARQLANDVHRLEVEIVATTRLAREHRTRNANLLPALERQGRSAGRPVILTHSQQRTHRQRFYLQSAQFVITSCLLAGAGAWLFKLWQSLQ